MTQAGRLILWLCAAAVVLGPILIAGAVARSIPVEWLEWLPWALAVAIIWSALAP